jgi:hypothetical protein
MIELLASVAGVFLEMGREWDNLNFRAKKSPRFYSKAFFY